MHPPKKARAEAWCHVEVVDDSLRISVPVEERRLQLCLLQKLPEALLDFVEVQDPCAQIVLSQILSSSSLETVEDVLANAGIRQLDVDSPRSAGSELDELCSKADSVLSISGETFRGDEKADPGAKEVKADSRDTTVSSDPEDQYADEKNGHQFLFRFPSPMKSMEKSAELGI